jgi:hypothetical protein
MGGHNARVCFNKLALRQRLEQRVDLGVPVCEVQAETVFSARWRPRAPLRTRRATAAATPESSYPHNVALVPRGFVLGRFPYAGQRQDPRTVMAGIRKPSPLATLQAVRVALESGRSW